MDLDPDLSREVDLFARVLRSLFLKIQQKSSDKIYKRNKQESSILVIKKICCVFRRTVLHRIVFQSITNLSGERDFDLDLDMDLSREVDFLARVLRSLLRESERDRLLLFLERE